MNKRERGEEGEKKKKVKGRSDFITSVMRLKFDYSLVNDYGRLVSGRYSFEGTIQIANGNVPAQGACQRDRKRENPYASDLGIRIPGNWGVGCLGNNGQRTRPSSVRGPDLWRPASGAVVASQRRLLTCISLILQFQKFRPRCFHDAVVRN